MDGICTLGNDHVYEQIIALINSIEAIMGKDTPICIYPYDDKVEKLASAIASRPNVELYSDRASIDKWDDFARQAWDTSPTARQIWQKAGSKGYHRFGTHRRYCAFDAPFDRFVYMDADTLLMSDLKPIFAALDNYDCVVYDFQHKDPSHVYDINYSGLNQIFSPTRIKQEIFCSGFYAARRNFFSQAQRNWLIEQLKKEARVLYPMAPDQTLINYMMMRSKAKIYNFALELPETEKTGCCVTSAHFVAKDNILYDKGKRLTYLHYIGLSSSLFARLCAGENIDFPYRDLFLHYRYLSEPEQAPIFQGEPQPYRKPASTFGNKIIKKLGLT